MRPADYLEGQLRVTRRGKTTLVAMAALILVIAVLLRLLSRPEFVTATVLEQASKALGLEITAAGVGEYRLRGTPQLVARDVVARVPGERTAVLRAERILISVPWSTLRARGNDLTARRLELDAPVLDVAALQKWQATRPPGKTSIPTLSDGIAIARGLVLGQGWKIDNLHAQLPSLAPDQAVRAHVQGRYVDGELRVPVDAHATLTRPASGAGVGIAGTLSLEQADWRLPSDVVLSAKLLTDNGIELQHAVLGAHSRYAAGATALPFSLGLAGPLRFDDNGISLQPAGLSIIGKDMMPTLQSSGSFNMASDLRLQLEGTLARWPEAWPALPPPLGQSASSLPFALAYAGASDLSAVALLRLQRDDTVFDARFRLFEVIDWVEAGAQGSPLPPVAGTLKTPKVEVSGALLEGVELQLEDPAIPAPAATE